jgi:hypothetical protein
MTRSFWLFGTRFTVHAHHEDTAARYDLIEGNGRLPPAKRNGGRSPSFNEYR